MSLPTDPRAPGDFDFMHGDWTVAHEMLDARLAGCTTWSRFTGLSSTRPLLGGLGNIEDNVFHRPGGDARGVALRSYDPAARTWSIWWLDGRNPTQLDVPVVGRFEDHVGTFFAQDVLAGRPIRVRFTWTATPGRDPRWEQAFSADDGVTWETNWRMVFVKVRSET